MTSNEQITAGLMRRLFARLIDSVVHGLICLPLLLSVAFSLVTRKQWAVRLDLVFLFIGLVFLFDVCLLYFFGASVGKSIMKLKMVSRDRQKLGFLQVIIRGLADHLSVFFGWGLFALALVRFDRTHLSDALAGTRIVLADPQDSDRSRFFPRRWFLGLFLFLVLSITGFSSAHQQMRQISFDGTYLILRT